MSWVCSTETSGTTLTPKHSFPQGPHCVAESVSGEEEKNYTGAQGDFAPKMQKRALENYKKKPLKIAIDCNVKACSMLQI